MVNAILILQSYGQHNPVYMPFVCTDYEFVKSHVGDKFGYDLKLTSESQAFANICLTPESAFREAMRIINEKKLGDKFNEQDQES